MRMDDAVPGIGWRLKCRAGCHPTRMILPSDAVQQRHRTGAGEPIIVAPQPEASGRVGAATGTQYSLDIPLDYA